MRLAFVEPAHYHAVSYKVSPDLLGKDNHKINAPISTLEN